ncbi:MAG: GTP-binding protein [Promethearchaeota archaeon]
MSKEEQFSTLLKNYMNDVKGVLAVAICDRDGLIMASVGREGTQSDEVIGAISAVLDSYIDRIKNEFGVEDKFFNITTTGDKKFAYCSKGPNSIITTIAEQGTSDAELKVYSEYIASKVELIIEGKENVSLEIPEIVRVTSKMRGGKLPPGEFSAKLIITGNYKVGKTSLIDRFVNNKFQESYISTLGVEISKKIVDLGPETNLNFIIWDIGGQKSAFDQYRARFYNGANAAFIVCDRTRYDTLDPGVIDWYNDIKKSIDRKIPIIIVGNKSDLEDNITVGEEDIKKIADNLGFKYILTSCKTGENVDNAFLYIAYKFLETV